MGGSGNDVLLRIVQRSASPRGPMCTGLIAALTADGEVRRTFVETLTPDVARVANEAAAELRGAST